MATGITAKEEIVINAPAEKVWKALTDPNMIREYLFGTNTITDWKPGSPISFEGEYQGKKYKDKGTIKEVQPNKILQYTYWSSMSQLEDKPENYFLITNKLTEEQGKTRLTLTQENVPNEEQKEHSEQNWKMVLGKMKKLVEEGK